VPSGPLPQPTAAPVPAPVTKVLPAEWPHAGYTGPQPWEAENPPALTQNHLMVSGGSAGAEVVELAAYLGALGYQTGIGDNPHAVYDSRLAGAVAQFSADYGCQEDPAVLRARTEDTVGPWLWEALVRAVHKKIAEAPAE
jgi:peptidoglycan hydrolase-like protein with peptidoglycan-binding domain